MVTRPHYSKNSQSAKAWDPRPVTQFSINNRSGGQHDIITHQPMQYQAGKTLGILDKQAVNRRKGVTEFADMQALACINNNVQHGEALNSNPYEFRRKNGVFTNMYDSAKRFGESKVFQASGIGSA